MQGLLFIINLFLKKEAAAEPLKIIAIATISLTSCKKTDAKWVIGHSCICSMYMSDAVLIFAVMVSWKRLRGRK